MARRGSKNSWGFFLVAVALSLSQCGVKLPPKADRIEEGPFARYNGPISQPSPSPSGSSK